MPCEECICYNALENPMIGPKESEYIPTNRVLVGAQYSLKKLTIKEKEYKLAIELAKLHIQTRKE